MKSQDELEECKEVTEYILKESKRLDQVQSLETVKDIFEKIKQIEEKGE